MSCITEEVFGGILPEVEFRKILAEQVNQNCLFFKFVVVCVLASCLKTIQNAKIVLKTADLEVDLCLRGSLLR